MAYGKKVPVSPAPIPGELWHYKFDPPGEVRMYQGLSKGLRGQDGSFVRLEHMSPENSERAFTHLGDKEVMRLVEAINNALRRPPMYWVVRYKSILVVSYCKEPKKTLCFTEDPGNAHRFYEKEEAKDLRDEWRKLIPPTEAPELLRVVKRTRRSE